MVFSDVIQHTPLEWQHMRGLTQLNCFFQSYMLFLLQAYIFSKTHRIEGKILLIDYQKNCINFI